MTEKIERVFMCNKISLNKPFFKAFLIQFEQKTGNFTVFRAFYRKFHRFYPFRKDSRQPQAAGAVAPVVFLTSDTYYIVVGDKTYRGKLDTLKMTTGPITFSEPEIIDDSYRYTAMQYVQYGYKEPSNVFSGCTS